MSPSLLEKLLLDRSLGVCPPPAEVNALLDAYLEEHPPACRELVAWHRIAGQAKAALADSVAPLPAFPRKRLHIAQRRHALTRVVTWAAGLAACLVIGTMAGRYWPKADIPALNVAKRPAPPDPKAAQAGVAAVQDFWSVSRLLAYARQNAASSAHAPAAPTFTPNPRAPFGGSL